jgi:O-antigen/teichoic acid export membrane protein
MASGEKSSEGVAVAASPFLESLTVTAATSGLLSLMFFASGTIAARILGPVERGALAAVQAAAGLLLTVGELGAPDALVFESARNPQRTGTYALSAMLITTAGSAIAVCAGYFAIPYLLGAQNATTISAARWYLLLAVSIIASGIPHAALRACGRMRLWNALRFAGPIIWLGTLCAVAFARTPTATMVVGVYLTILLLVSIPLGAWICRYRIPGRFALDAETIMPMLRFGIPQAASHFPRSLNLRVDQILMAAMLPPRMLGLYVVAVAWSGIASPLPGAIGLVLFPHVASRGAAAGRADALARVTRLTVPILLAAGALLCIATAWSIPLIFGREYADSVPVGYILVAAASVLEFSQLLEEGLRGLGDTVAILRGQLAGVVVTILALALMMRPWGIIGAAIASLLGYSTVAASLIASACKSTGVSPADLLMPRKNEIKGGLAHVGALAKTLAKSA